MEVFQTENKSLALIEVVCAWCGCFMGTKVSTRPIVHPVSHGICQQCKETVINEFKAELERSPARE